MAEWTGDLLTSCLCFPSLGHGFTVGHTHTTPVPLCLLHLSVWTTLNLSNILWVHKTSLSFMDIFRFYISMTSQAPVLVVSGFGRDLLEVTGIRVFVQSYTIRITTHIDSVWVLLLHKTGIDIAAPSAFQSSQRLIWLHSLPHKGTPVDENIRTLLRGEA